MSLHEFSFCLTNTQKAEEENCPIAGGILRKVIFKKNEKIPLEERKEKKERRNRNRKLKIKLSFQFYAFHVICA